MSLEFENSRIESQNRVYEKSEQDGSPVAKEIAEVLRGEKPETVSEYPASPVVAMLRAIERQMISDGAIRIGEMHFAGPVPDEGDNPTELEGKW